MVFCLMGHQLCILGHRLRWQNPPTSFAPGRYDVVISNLGMADMNGWEFAERLRLFDKKTAILFVTGWGLREEDMSRLIVQAECKIPALNRLVDAPSR